MWRSSARFGGCAENRLSLAKDRGFDARVLPALSGAQRDGQPDQSESKHADGKADEDHGAYRIFQNDDVVGQICGPYADHHLRRYSNPAAGSITRKVEKCCRYGCFISRTCPWG